MSINDGAICLHLPGGGLVCSCMECASWRRYAEDSRQQDEPLWDGDKQQASGVAPEL